LSQTAAVADQTIENPRDRESLHLHLFGPLNSDHFFNEERQQFAPQKGLRGFYEQEDLLGRVQGNTTPHSQCGSRLMD